MRQPWNHMDRKLASSVEQMDTKLAHSHSHAAPSLCTSICIVHRRTEVKSGKTQSCVHTLSAASTACMADPAVWAVGICPSIHQLSLPPGLVTSSHFDRLATELVHVQRLYVVVVRSISDVSSTCQAGPVSLKGHLLIS